jgi:CheY-like chemotaxis protein
MNGEITVVSQVDVGSEFRVRLPLAEVHAPARPVSCRQLEIMDVEIPHQAAIEQSTGEVAEGDSEETIGRLLLAEDNEINQMVAVELLKMSGWAVDVANNGIEAIAAAQRTEYDAILMDCQMPEMDGLTAAREIRLLEAAGRLPRYNHELIPIIAFTANAAMEDREQCLAAGMNAFAAKPLVIEQLLDTIERAVPTKKSKSRRPALAKTCPTVAEACSTLL